MAWVGQTLKRLIVLILPLVCCAADPAGAHHSFAAYVRTVSRTIEGSVKEFSWSNPHVKLVIMAEGPDGVAKPWSFEGGSVNRLALNGFTRGMIAPGDKVTVSYNPRRDRGAGGFFFGIKSPNGKTYSTERSRGPTRGGAEEG